MRSLLLINYSRAEPTIKRANYLETPLQFNTLPNFRKVLGVIIGDLDAKCEIMRQQILSLRCELVSQNIEIGNEQSYKLSKIRKGMSFHLKKTFSNPFHFDFLKQYQLLVS